MSIRLQEENLMGKLPGWTHCQNHREGSSQGSSDASLFQLVFFFFKALYQNKEQISNSLK